MAKDFEQLPHTADIKIRVFGTTLKDLFKHALVGMFQVIRPIVIGCTIEKDRVVCRLLPEQRTVEVSSIDIPALLVDFLSEALYLSDVHNEAYLDATIHHLNETHIKATLYGVKVTGFQVVELKAVTYHDLQVKQVRGQWQADIVFDI
jgi:SHS2 domain-containing protein